MLRGEVGVQGDADTLQGHGSAPVGFPQVSCLEGPDHLMPSAVLSPIAWNGEPRIVCEPDTAEVLHVRLSVLLGCLDTPSDHYRYGSRLYRFGLVND